MKYLNPGVVPIMLTTPFLSPTDPNNHKSIPSPQAITQKSKSKPSFEKM